MILGSVVNEKSTVDFVVSFKDIDGNAEIPDSIKWTLTDLQGIIVNSRENVIVTPASSVTITLTGNDLELDSSVYDGVFRYLTILSVKGSSSIVETIQFKIAEMPVIPS